jgi:hypothetical protein
VKYIVLPKKEFREKYGPTTEGVHYTEGEEHVVVVPRGAGPRTRLHELAHLALGHESGDGISLGEQARRELEADTWVYEKLGRSPSLREIYLDLRPLVEEAFRKGYSVSNAMV